MDDITLEDDLVKKNFTYVRVLHNFRGSNNDELYMKRDDIITLTQTPSGGWWEGTLNGITGWFPANYVTPILHNEPLYQQLVQSASTQSDNVSNLNNYVQFHCENGSVISEINGENLVEYRAIVIKDIEDSETVFIKNLHDAINLYLKPLYQYKIFPTDTEINAVLRSITEICSVHRRFLTSLDKIKDASPKDNRIGGLFMQFAPQFKHAHFEYCSNHAKFVHLVEKYKKEICSFFASHPGVTQQPPSPSHATQNAASMPNVIITSSLSVSFRRLDKYPALLQELQRYTEENHVDRGDTQRAGFLYREIAMSCLELRRRKEMELEVMLGNIKNFDGLKIEILGTILKMEPVSLIIMPTWAEPKKDCYLVLFPKVLMVLSVGNEMTSFTFESLMQLENSRLQVLQASTSDSGVYQLEISGNIVNCQSSSEVTYLVQFTNEDIYKEWYQLLQKQIRHLSPNSDVGNVSAVPLTCSLSSSSITSPQSVSSSSIFSPQTTSSCSEPPPPLPPVGKPPIGFHNQNLVSSILSTRPPPPPPQHRAKGQISQANLITSIPKRTSYWSQHLLTPHSPYRPYNDNLPNKSNDSIIEQNEDMQLLNVIDSYHRKFPGNSWDKNCKSRKLSNPTIEMDLDGPEPHQFVEIIENIQQYLTKDAEKLAHKKKSNMTKQSLTKLANKISKLSISSIDRDILYDIYDQLKLINNEIIDMNNKIKEERLHRKRMQQTIMAHYDNSNNYTT